ncbi:MAG: hypothetical protein EXS40_10695 [Opitutaceae bacterium]|nr:hypothetical protein [Opitutaceae bacterium]
MHKALFHPQGAALIRGFFKNEVEADGFAGSRNDHEDGQALRFPICGGPFEGQTVVDISVGQASWADDADNTFF